MAAKKFLALVWGFSAISLSLVIYAFGMLMNQENIWSLLSKKLSGEATTSELTELEQLLRANPELHYSVQPLMDLWQADNGLDHAAGREAFERHLQRMEGLGVDFSVTAPPEKKRGPLRVALFTVPLLAVVIIAGRLLFAGAHSRQASPASPDK